MGHERPAHWQEARDFSGSIQAGFWQLDAVLSKETGLNVQITPVQWLLGLIVFFLGMTCALEWAVRRFTESASRKMGETLERHRARWRRWRARWRKRRARRRPPRRHSSDDDEEVRDPLEARPRLREEEHEDEDEEL